MPIQACPHQWQDVDIISAIRSGNQCGKRILNNVDDGAEVYEARQSRIGIDPEIRSRFEPLLCSAEASAALIH